MKKATFFLVLMLLVTLATGCLYTGVKFPSTSTANYNGVSTAKMGDAKCHVVLGVVAWGDCSTEAAMRDGGVKKLHHVDQGLMSIWFIYQRYTTKAYGE